MRAMQRRSGGRANSARLSVALALCAGLFAASLPACAASPLDTIRGFYATLLATMKEGPNLGESGRYAALAPVVRRVFDVPFMTRLAVGPDWAGWTFSQQQRVTVAFGRYVAATYADRFDSYSGEALEVDSEQPFAGGFIVHTRIVKPKGEPVRINYLLRAAAGGWQIGDVYLDGTISQLATQHSEFHSILRREGVDGLIAALDRKVDLLKKRSAENSP